MHVVPGDPYPGLCCWIVTLILPQEPSVMGAGTLDPPLHEGIPSTLTMTEGQGTASTGNAVTVCALAATPGILACLGFPGSESLNILGRLMLRAALAFPVLPPALTLWGSGLVPAPRHHLSCSVGFVCFCNHRRGWKCSLCSALNMLCQRPHGLDTTEQEPAWCRSPGSLTLPCLGWLVSLGGAGVPGTCGDPCAQRRSWLPWPPPPLLTLSQTLQSLH